MEPHQSAFEKGSGGFLPTSLAEWVSRDALLESVRESVMAASATQLVPVRSAETGTLYPASDMLTAVLYCYASGVYSSRVIAERLEADTQQRLMGGGEWPDRFAWSRFRRQNRQVISRCLEEVALNAWQNRTPSTPPPGASGLDAGATLESLRPQVRHEVTERILRAVQMDSMSLDW